MRIAKSSELRPKKKNENHFARTRYAYRGLFETGGRSGGNMELAQKKHPLEVVKRAVLSRGRKPNAFSISFP
jgi:hypothetical protein